MVLECLGNLGLADEEHPRGLDLQCQVLEILTATRAATPWEVESKLQLARFLLNEGDQAEDAEHSIIRALNH
jgi:hypothetical protein